jgi:hypothetical protein
MAGECQRLLYLVPTKDGAPQVPGEGGMAGECQKLLYQAPTKDGGPQVPGNGSMADECKRLLYLVPTKDSGPQVPGKRRHGRQVSEVAIRRMAHRRSQGKAA